MNSTSKKRLGVYGIFIYHSHIWLSELVSIFVVGVVIATLFFVLSLIVYNNRRINKQSELILKLKTEQILFAKKLDEVKEKMRIFEAVTAVFGKTVPIVSLYHIVDIVYKNSKTYGYDPLLVLAVIYIESSFNVRALGKYKDGQLSGALGLMQLKFETACEVARDLDIELKSPEDLMKPEVNLVLGLGYLTRMISKFKNFKLGLLAYNQGPAVISNNIFQKEELSLRYYHKVLNSYFHLKTIVDKNKFGH